MYRDHPKWTLNTFHRNGGTCLVRIDEIHRWKRQILNGGTQYDKSRFIKDQTCERFVEARDNHEPVTMRNLQEWAMQAFMVVNGDEPGKFMASESWISRFKKEYRISQRKVTKFMKVVEKRSLETIASEAEKFQSDCRESIAALNKDYVLNTDQMGCEYRAPVNRTYTNKGEKSVFVFLGDTNKLTHSYTAQYTSTASGKLLPKVFVCLQEAKGVFGPVVQKKIDELSRKYKNVCITCSKSGKLSKNLVDLYTSEIIEPYVEDESFLLVLDSWGGQKDADIFKKFENSLGKSNCTLKIIPPGTTSICQPLDVYFHRQAKILIKELQNSTYLIQQQRQINTREDAIKIQSIVHNQLSAPIFRDMIEYSWFASKLISTREIFKNVIEVCFPERPCRKMCQNLGQNCQKTFAFIKCSWCRNYLCFRCFYDEYHPANCDSYFRNV